MRFQPFLSLLLVLFFLPFHSSVAKEYEKVAEKALFNGEKIQEFKLKNGLRVLLISRHQAKVLSYQVWFDVGSIQEKLDPRLNKTGLAHLFEHMMFRGTKKFPDGEFDRITSKIGADKQNATTYFYRTNYFENIPSKQLSTLMELEADRMANLNIESEPFEKEKGAVVGELRRGLDQPGRVAWDELMALANPTTPYRFTVIGTEAEIKGFTVEEANYFYRTFYAPNNATLIVIGDTTEKTLMPMVVKYYGEMQSQKTPSIQIPKEVPRTKEARVIQHHRQATSEILMVAYPIPPITSNEIVPLSLLSTHLSVGLESVLHKKLVDSGLAVNSHASTGSQPDLFQIMVQMAEGKKSEAALKVIDKEIAALMAQPISKEQFTRALNQDKLNLYGDIADNSALANLLGEFLMLSKDYMRGFELLAALEKLKPSDISQSAKKYLQTKNRAVVILRPGMK